MAVRCERDEVSVLRLEIATEEEAARLIWNEAARVSEEGHHFRALHMQLGGQGAVDNCQDLREKLQAAEHALEETLGAQRDADWAFEQATARLSCDGELQKDC